MLPHNEDCKQILKLSLILTHTLKRPARLQPGEPSEDLPYGQSGIRRLSARIRCAPAFCQSSSTHNSLRSVKQTAVWRLESSSPENFGDSAILPKAKISASLIEILSSRSHKTPAIYAPFIPTGEE